MELIYQKVERKDVPLLKKMQATIFPSSSFEDGYDLVYEKGPETLDYLMFESEIVYADGEPAGITGLNITKGVEEHHSIWLNWYGILPSFRGKGLGKRILLDSFEQAKTYMKDYPVKYFRLYTGEFVNPSAQPLYRKVMTMKEYYTHEELFTGINFQKTKAVLRDKTDEECKKLIEKCTTIYSRSLDENEIIVPWNNYFLNLSAVIAVEKGTYQENAD